MDIRTRAWIEQDGLHVFGEGKSGILKAIDDAGSLNAAAKALGMSYRHVWSSITTAEERLGKALIVRQKGGKSGGGTSLTPYAIELMRTYDRFNREVRAYADKTFQRLFKDQL
jgi:molybdate transport system regulatory protein